MRAMLQHCAFEDESLVLCGEVIWSECLLNGVLETLSVEGVK